MSTLQAANIQSLSSATLPVINDSAGTEYGRFCRAFVNFNGTTSPGTIRASFNVSSVTKNGTGDYTVNFTNSMADGNYIASCMTTGSGSATGSQPAGVKFRCSTTDGAASDQLAGSCRVIYGYGNSQVAYDSAQITLAFFR